MLHRQRSNMMMMKSKLSPSSYKNLLIIVFSLWTYNLISDDFVNHVAATELAAAATLSGSQQAVVAPQATTSNSNSLIKHPSSVNAQLLPKLPKINIYLGRNETKRLLGIDTKINYVNEGTINTYPLGFSIPLGYNQSDMIFTWQNLGQTNVTYSISLQLSNAEAVNPPSINITRTGLIPKHEQVFRITLPCSGKFTNEVDVEVFMNISGYVPVDDDDFLLAGAAANDDDELDTDLDPNGSADVVRTATTGGAENPSTTTTSTTAATSSGGNTTTVAAAAEEALRNQMQSDQADSSQLRPAIVMRPVSHQIAIKRKKICTMHPVPVQPNTYPPTQPAQRPALPAPPPPPALASNSNNNNKWPPIQSQTPADQVVAQATRQLAPATSEPISSQTISSATSLEAPSKANFDPTPRQQHQAGAPGARLHINNNLHQYPNWPPFPPPPPGSAIAKIAPDNPLNEILIRQQQQQQLSQSSNQQPTSFVLPVLALLSVLISLALIVVVLLASAGNSSSFLLNKLNALKSCRLLRRTKQPASSLARSATTKSLPSGGHSAMISSLRAGLKSSAASSVSGLSAISGHSQLTGKSQLPAYCYKGATGANYAPSHYYGQQQFSAASGPPHYHHQQQQHLPTPTADLLGTGYQCHQQQPPQYPIYHIETTTANAAQTTRLIWQNGNGTSPDGFTMDGSYMPLSNHAPRSSDDTNSAYQTIY